VTEVVPSRRAAFEVIRRVFEHDAWADRAFPAAAERHGLDARARAHAQWLAYGAVKRRATADHFMAGLSDRPIGKLDPPVLAALRLGLFELLFATRPAEHAAIDQAVELAKGGMGERERGRAAGGLVNAVLRRAVRERDALLGGLADATPEEAAIAHSYPLWLVRMMWAERGPADARSLLVAMNEPAETAVRVNTLRADPKRIAESLRGAGQEVERASRPDLLAPADSLVLSGRLTEATLERLAAGELVAQSRASQAVVGVLDPRPGERVLDLCAGPGIKTSSIASRMANEGEVVAVEIDSGRAGELRELCGRLGASTVRVVEADATKDDVGDGYDRVLVDPPCSDLGALGSRPDARWRKSPELIDRLVSVQDAILARGARSLRPGGTLVYSTCTISAREGEERLAAELERAPEMIAVDLGAAHPELASSSRDRRFLQTRPDRDGTDGFFIARLARTAEG
jgi:16S rRNA (cytosine967-C5)-methyltransferase